MNTVYSLIPLTMIANVGWHYMGMGYSSKISGKYRIYNETSDSSYCDDLSTSNRRGRQQLI